MSVKIQLDETTRLISDKYQWSLQKPHMNKGEKKWESYAFYSTIESACDGYVRERVRDSNAESIAPHPKGNA